VIDLHQSEPVFYCEEGSPAVRASTPRPWLKAERGPDERDSAAR